MKERTELQEAYYCRLFDKEAYYCSFLQLCNISVNDLQHLQQFSRSIVFCNFYELQKTK